MVRGTRPVVTADLADENAIKAWLDALANGSCDVAAFLQFAHENFKSDPDGNWAVLSLLDQYYRRGRITSEVFHPIKNALAESALGAPNTPNRPMTREVETRDIPVATEVVAPQTTIRPEASTSHTPRGSKSTEDPPVELQPGSVLRRRYRLEGVLGQSAMGTVFQALDEYRLEIPPVGQRLAIKVLHAPVTKRAELLTELRREFQQMQRLSHPNILRVFEFDRDGASVFFTMELLNGTRLQRVLQERKFVPVKRPQALAIIRDIGAAVAHAHSRGVVHGNINPQAIFFDVEGLRVLDFGASQRLNLSMAAAPDHAATLPSATAGYASCQLLEGHPAEARDDVFALACVAFVLLSGEHPFGKKTAIEARDAQLSPRRPEKLTDRQWRALRSALRFERADRPEDMEQWLRELELHRAAKHVAPLAELLELPVTGQSKSLPIAALAAMALFIALGFWVIEGPNIAPGPGTPAEPNSAAQTSLSADDAAAPGAPAPGAAAPATTTAAVRAPDILDAASAPTVVAPSAGAPTVTASAIAPPALASPAIVPSVIAPSAGTPSADTPSADTPPTGAPAPIAPSAAAIAPVVSSAPPAAAAAVPIATRAAAPAVASTSSVPASATAPQPPAVVPAGPTKIELGSDTIDVPPGEASAQVPARRKGSLKGETSFTWWTESGTAKPGVDFSPVVPQLAHVGDGKSTISLSIPLTATARTQPKSFYVVIDHSEGGATIAARTLTMVTLLPAD